MSQDTYKLLECPFCGGSATTYDISGDAICARVECDKCYAQTIGDDLYEAIDIWNNRN